jgi:signal transduction histidine kinase
LEVRDDGIGFDVPAHLGGYVGRGRLGLVSMRERAEEVGGTFEIESEPGGGTRIVVYVPLSPAHHGEAIV